MTIDEFLTAIEEKSPPASDDAIARFEQAIGRELPTDYRDFLVRCNGGYAGGNVIFPGPIGEVSVNHIGGFRDESHFSLEDNRSNYQHEEELRIPLDLIWIADDPGGNAICLGINGSHRGRVYFWDHECEPDPETWDGSLGSAENIDLLAESFTKFVAGLTPANSDDTPRKPWWRFW